MTNNVKIALKALREQKYKDERIHVDEYCQQKTGAYVEHIHDSSSEYASYL